MFDEKHVQELRNKAICQEVSTVLLVAMMLVVLINFSVG